MAERTGTNLRGRTFLGGRIIFNSGESSIDCIVRRITTIAPLASFLVWRNEP